MNKETIAKMDDGKEKKLMELLSEDGKPFVKKCDGYAKKMEEDVEVTYNDYNEQELTLKVPEGSYLVVEKESNYPKIVTAEEFEGNNKFVSGDDAPKKEKKSKKSDDGPKIGIESMEGY